MSVFSEMDLEKKYEGDPFAEDDEPLNTAGLEAKTTPSVVTAAPESPEPPASPAPAAPADKATEDEEEEAKRKAHKEEAGERRHREADPAQHEGVCGRVHSDHVH